MPGLIRRLRAKSWGERALLAEALVALGVASLMLAVIPFRRVMALVRPAAARPTAAAEEARVIALVRAAIMACARRVPWRALCLEQALASQWMLRRRRIAATVHYGVGRADDRLQAHAWVRTSRFDVIGCENAGEFAELARFPAAAAKPGRA